ncbi:MAG: threonine-phosphate decarboxylase CobD [Phormidesmis sp.]
MDRPVHGGNLSWAARLAQCEPDELLDFSASISPLGPPCSVYEAISTAFSSVTAYPDPEYWALREAIAQYHSLPIEYVFPGNGAAELLNWAARELAGVQRCFCLSPGFGDYERSLRAYHCEPTQISLFDEQLTYQDNWDAELVGKLPLATCGLLLNNPHNPTGQLFEAERVRSLIARFALVVVDEAFMDFFPDAQSQSVITSAERFPKNLVVIRSLTKFYSIPGLRLGYAIAHPDKLEQWRQWRDPWSVNSLAAAAGIAALKDTKFQQQSWDWLAEENPFLFEGLSRFEALKPMKSSANFLLVHCQVSAIQLQARLLQRHQIYIRDCMSFDQLGDHFFRVAIKTRENNQRLLDAIADVLPELEA